jgi:hypothetical protein
MRARISALLLLAAIAGAARAEIRIDESRFVGGRLVIRGETAPHRTVTLDDKFTTTSNADGTFSFSVDEKPFTCMSEIRAGDDVYSAVIAGCLDAEDVDNPPAADKPEARPAR